MKRLKVYLRGTNHEVENYRRDRRGVPKKCKVFARVTGVRTCRAVGATLLEILDREIRCVGDRTKARHERGVDLPDRIPVHAVEKRMVLDLFDVQSPISTGDEPVMRMGGTGLNQHWAQSDPDHVGGQCSPANQVFRLAA